MSETLMHETANGVGVTTRVKSLLLEKLGAMLLRNPSWGAITVMMPDGRTRTIASQGEGDHAQLRRERQNVADIPLRQKRR